eukprot:3882763-Amphidinium_carterae.2
MRRNSTDLDEVVPTRLRPKARRISFKGPSPEPPRWELSGQLFCRQGQLVEVSAPMSSLIPQRS